jgi:hypothetical protein
MLSNILFLTIAFIISAIPLHISVKLLNGKTTFLKTVFISVISGIVFSAVYEFFKWGLIALFVLIWIYHEAFKLKWWKAAVAWVLQFIVIIILSIIAALIIGATIAAAFI